MQSQWQHVAQGQHTQTALLTLYFCLYLSLILTHTDMYAHTNTDIIIRNGESCGGQRVITTPA